MDWWALVVAALLVYAGVHGLSGTARRWGRLVRGTGVVVRRDGIWTEQNVRTRVTTFEFATASGEVIRATSRAKTFPGPRVGSKVPVVYDAKDPHGMAERVGVHRVLLVLHVALLLGGLVLAVAAVVTG